MRVYSLEVAQNIEVQRGRFDRFGPTFAQAFEMALGGQELLVSNLRFLSLRASLRPGQAGSLESGVRACAGSLKEQVHGSRSAAEVPCRPGQLPSGRG